MSATVDVVNASGERPPPRRQLKAWVDAALKGAGHKAKTSLSLRIVDEREGAELNGNYRKQRYATNVLSFPVPPELLAAGQLGDIALCAAVVKREAREQNKKQPDHWAHLVVHGVLHLLGYDHEHDKDSRKMEALEIRILAGLGIGNPYTP